MAADLLDGFTDRVLDSQDKVLFEEAVRAGNAGAFRAAYIAVWLSCAESLKRKFSDASAYDGAAAKISGDISRKEANHQAVDGFLLEKSKNYGFISDTEFTHLNAMYEQRCIYGHPYEEAPLAEQLVSAAATAVEYVLSRPVMLRDGYLDRQIGLICGNRTFLDDHFPAIESYAHLVHKRSSDDLHLWFLRKLWGKADAFAGDPSMAVFMRRVVWFTEAFIGNSDESFFTRWNATQDLVAHSFVASALAAPNIFPRIGEHSQDIVVGTLLSNAQIQAASLKTIEGLESTGLLTARQQQRFEETMKPMALSVLGSSGVNPRHYVGRVIQDLKSHNWYTQNPAVDVIRGMGVSGISKLSSAEQLTLGNNVLQAADGSATNAIEFIGEISESEMEWPASFIEGLVAECVVNDDDMFRFKTECATNAFRCLARLPGGQRAEVVSRVVTRLSEASPCYSKADKRFRDRILRRIDEAMRDDKEKLVPIQKLRKAIADLELSEDE